jgi:hypothetical protein
MDKDGTKTMGGDGGFGLAGMRHSGNGGKSGRLRVGGKIWPVGR